MARREVLPGFRLAAGVTVAYLSILVLLPLGALLLSASGVGPARLLALVTTPRALASLRLSVLASLAAASVNVVCGVLVAWVLERYPFPGRRVVNALVDLPFALPTAVAGISLCTVYGKNGWIGRFLEPAGIKVAYAPLGVVAALIFVGFPFVVRSVGPVLRALDPAVEEAAASLGASRLTTFCRVVMPELLPAAATGFVLALARGLGEYGSIIFIAGNIPGKTEIVPLLIMIKLEEYDYPGAMALAVCFLGVSFVLLLALNALAWRGALAREATA